MKRAYISAPTPTEETGVAVTGEQLAALRAVLGLSRHQVAEALGVGYATLGAWESSRCPISAGHEQQWRTAIDVATQVRLRRLARQGISLGVLQPKDISRARGVLKLG